MRKKLATFELDKTNFVRLIRNGKQLCNRLLLVDGEQMTLKDSTKLLEIAFNPQVRFPNIFLGQRSEALQAAMAPKRLRALRPNTTR